MPVELILVCLGAGALAALATPVTAREIDREHRVRPVSRPGVALASAAPSVIVTASVWARSDFASPVDAIATLLAFTALAVWGVALAAIDLGTHRLPNRLVLPAYPVLAALLVIACLGGHAWADAARALIAGLVLFALYAALRAVSGRGLGGGDVKLAGVLGIATGWLGWDAVIVGVIGTFVVGGLVAVALMAVGRARASTAIPFGPSMLGGSALGVALGLPLAQWYLQR